MLGWSAVWISVMAVVMLTGAWRAFSELAYLALGFGLGLPTLLLPLVSPHPSERGRPWADRYAVRVNLWIAVVVWVGSYFITHYFFDVMGMRYGFPVEIHWEAAIVGRSDQSVPLFLYPLTQAYFITYYTIMAVVLRWARSVPALQRGVGYAVVTIALCYGVAWAETTAMAVELLRDVFSYASRERMMAFGSLFYALLFLCTLPLFTALEPELDRDPSHRRPLRTLALEALGASALGMALMDVVSSWLGPLATGG